jgi:hypothetical protein
MQDYAIWIHIVLGISLALAGCCAFAFFGETIRKAVAAFLAIFTGLMEDVRANCARWTAAVRGWLREQMADENGRKQDGPVYFIIGAVVYSILTIVFMLCDWGMIILTAEGMGLDTARFQLPLDTACLTATTLVTSALFWGSVFFDALGVTHIAPWHKPFSLVGRRVIMGVSLAFLVLAVAIGGVMAFWRGDMLTGLVPEAAAGTTETGMESGGLDLGPVGADPVAITSGPEAAEARFGPDALRRQAQMVKFSLVGLAVLSAGSTAFSMVGVMKLAKFVILATIGLASLPLLVFQGLTWLLTRAFNYIFNFIHWLIDVPITIGSRILGAFGVQTGDAAAHDAGVFNQAPAPGADNGTPPASEPSADAQETGFNPFSRR